MTRTSSTSEKPLCQPPRTLTAWLNPDGQRKVHSLVDKVYQPKNLRAAWEKVKANRGSGGIDGQSLKEFEQGYDQRLHRLHEELCDGRERRVVFNTVGHGSPSSVEKNWTDIGGCSNPPPAPL